LSAVAHACGITVLGARTVAMPTAWARRASCASSF